MKVLLPGLSRGAVALTESDPSHSRFKDLSGVKLKDSREVKGLARGSDTQVLVDAAPDEVLELEFEGGLRQWVSVAQLSEDMECAGHRSALLGGVAVPMQPLGAAEGGGSRGAAEWALKGLKLLGFDPVSATAGLAERALIGKFEEKLDPPAGLYPLAGPAARGKEVTAEGQFDASNAALIFLHGTASTITGSFNGMAGAWKKLGEQYDARIYGFQHKTLSVSPVTNALALARLIPAKAKLHLVSHSRGGLVGELLCIRKISAEQLEAFRLKAAQRDKEAKVPKEEQDERAAARAEELADLKKLSDLLEKKEFEIQRFVRVACPARGTILASGRLDLYLSLITSAIGLAVESTPYLQPIHEFLQAVTIEVARRRTRPEGLPGLEAQMPESPLIHLLNNTGLQSQADLAVIAGDIDMGGGFWKSLGVLATNLFYLEKHDLVVNTAAMSAGMARAGGTWMFADEGSEVSHFNYFKNPKTRDRLLSWLAQPAGQNVDAEFKLQPRSAGGAAASRSGGGRDVANLPALFILPGIMGTRLKNADGTLWMDQQRLSSVGMAGLELGAAGIETDGIVQAGYQALEQYFATTYRVVLFDYDWRRSVADAAVQLAKEIKKLHAEGKVVRIVAHSMGGLVARAMIAQKPELWKAIRAQGGRLLQLGTPNRGSFAIPRLLWGVEPTVQMLAMLDPRQTKAEICQILADFPGVVDMLPETADGCFFDESWWAKDHGQLAKPEPAELRRAKGLRTFISGGDVSGIFYVAGISEATVTDLTFDGTAPAWVTTEEGDGTVPYTLGRLAGVDSYYVAAVHGELANEPTAFAGYAELLANGATTRLSKTPPPLTRSVAAGAVLRGPEPVLFPTEEELVAAALGTRRHGRQPRREMLPALNLAVRHGDLRRSPLPLVIGHYLGDKIVSAESILDRQLGGRLTRREALGLYPGAEGTIELVLAPGCHPPGALVVGLGQIGEISVEKVRRAVREAALRYALHLVENSAPSKMPDAAHRAGLSVLLLGTHGGRALRVTDSVTAIVSGLLDANEALAGQKLTDRVCFVILHIVELYETVATEALSAARRLALRLRSERADRQEVLVAPYVQTLGRGRLQPPLNPYDTGWWPRIEITEETGADGKGTGNYRFSLPTSRAGVEERIASAQAAAIDRYVEKAIVSSALDEKAASNLFQLLVPNNLKSRLDAEADNAVIVVDRTTARIPWEMLGRQRLDGTVEFLGLKMGLLRQFKTTDSQPRPPDSRSFRAVVIGDTDSPFAPLPGAVAEARAVREMLKRHHYTVPEVPLERADFAANLDAILTVDYRILHVAAHGEFNADPTQPSGVVFGKDEAGKPLFLTSREIRQMPAMPELVFLNCCHLGLMATPEEAGRLRTVNSLAASLAEELINKGVKVVVAAGWAVHDGAAEVFAREFYGQMLSGSSFGDAVKHARKAAFDQFKNVNTWAAYQCYGSPDYRLEGSATDAETSKSGEPGFGTRTEFLHAILDLQSQTAEGSAPADHRGLRAKLDALELSLPEMWQDGEVLSALGSAWGEIGDYEKAVTLLHRAVEHPAGGAPFRAAEQLANFEDRAAAAQAKGGGATAEMRQRWKRVETSLRRLLATARTPERLSLLAASQKRRAGFATNKKERDTLIRESIANYRTAYELSIAQNQMNQYPGLNWLTHLALLPKRDAETEALLRRELPRLREAIDAQTFTETDLEMWRKIHGADALLLDHLVAGDLHLPAVASGVEAAYAAVLDAGVTQREIGSVTGGLQSIIDSLTRTGATFPNLEKTLKFLNDLRSLVSR